jgi:cytochrome c oxidase subunit 2
MREEKVNIFYNLYKLIRFAEPASDLMEGIIDLHHSIIFYLILTYCVIMWLMLNLIYNQKIIKEFERMEIKEEIKNSIVKNKYLSVSESLNYLKESILDYKKKYGVYFFNYKIEYGRYFIKNKVIKLILSNVNLRNFMKEELDGKVIEIFWLFLPTIILILMAIPSLALVYTADMFNLNPELVIKVIGHQWYWSYEIVDGNKQIRFDSEMVTDFDLKEGDIRLREVYNPLELPSNVPLAIIVTSDDVIHSWAVPSLGIKVDGIPGRLNMINTIIKKPGVYYGGCSELCGVNHGYMPIVIKVNR